MTIMLAPAPNRTYIASSSGNSYAADANAIIASVPVVSDVTDLQSAGCVVLTPPPTDLLGKLLQANFNTTSDQLIPATFLGKYRVRRITVANTTVAGMSTAAGGFYTGASKGGSAIVASSQVYTGLTNATTALDLTIALPNLIITSGTPLYLSLSTPQGATAKADVYVYGDVL